MTTGTIVAQTWERPATFCLALSPTPQDETIIKPRTYDWTGHRPWGWEGEPTPVSLLNEQRIKLPPNDLL